MSLHARLPWQIKILAKILLSRIPSDYALWRTLGLFKHGHMEKPEYAYTTFRRHFDRLDYKKKHSGLTTLELGPGDSLFTALISSAFGGFKTYLVDTGNFARNDIEPYYDMVTHLRDLGMEVPNLANTSTLEEILVRCNATYHVDGLESLRTIPDCSVDFVFSQAVLEHIRRDQFLDVMRELRRIIRNDGIHSHRVDLKDHLGGGLNNLRFSGSAWESKFMVSSGFYTNRIRYFDMLELFETAGFLVQVLNKDSWEYLPISRSKLAHEFRDMPFESLRVSGFDVVLVPRS
jgi:SAM-dependent methyltransferase